MIFESIAAITSALSVVNGLVAAAKETGGNVTGVLGKMGEIQDGIHRFELEKKREASIPTQRLTPSRGFCVSGEKASGGSLLRRRKVDLHDEHRRLKIVGRVRTHNEGVEGTARQGRKIIHCASKGEKGVSSRSNGLVGGGVLRVDYSGRSDRTGHRRFSNLDK